MTYHIGQKVRIRNIALGESGFGYVFIENMAKHCGTVSEIIEMYDNTIRLRCTGLHTGWIPEWLAPADFLEDMDFDI